MVAQWWGYKPEEFAELEGDVQSARIAAFRAKHQADAVLAYEQAKEARRKRPKRR